MVSLKRRAWGVQGLPALLALSLSMVSTAGCGGNTEGGLVPVSGRVTFDGGPWPKAGQIVFSPVAGGAAAEGGKEGGFRPGTGKFDTDGKFTVSSYEDSDGLYPGMYKAAIDCWVEPPGMSPTGQPTGKSAVPKKYRSGDTSGFSLTVVDGKPADVTFNVESSFDDKSSGFDVDEKAKKKKK